MFQTDTDDDTDSDDDDFIATSDNNEAANNDHNDTDSLSGEILNMNPKEHFPNFRLHGIRHYITIFLRLQLRFWLRLDENLTINNTTCDQSNYQCNEIIMIIQEILVSEKWKFHHGDNLGERLSKGASKDSIVIKIQWRPLVFKS